MTSSRRLPNNFALQSSVYLSVTMGAFGISLILAIGGGAWVYNKSQQRNGGLVQQSLTAAGVAGAVLFIVCITILLMVLPK